jgi:hypothetical protein
MAMVMVMVGTRARIRYKLVLTMMTAVLMEARARTGAVLVPTMGAMQQQQKFRHYQQQH